MLIILGPAITEGEPAMNQQSSVSKLVTWRFWPKGVMQAALPAASSREGADKLASWQERVPSLCLLVHLRASQCWVGRHAAGSECSLSLLCLGREMGMWPCRVGAVLPSSACPFQSSYPTALITYVVLLAGLKSNSHSGQFS